MYFTKTDYHSLASLPQAIACFHINIFYHLFYFESEYLIVYNSALISIIPRNLKIIPLLHFILYYPYYNNHIDFYLSLS